ncbi:MAG: DUF2892 domain-containing protein [Bacteroidota bacterium]
MNKNMGNFDRLVRVVLAAILAYLAATGVVTGAVAILFYILSGVFLLTSFISFCPLYVPFGWNTNGNGKRRNAKS